MTTVHPELAGGDGGFQAELERVVAALGGRAPIALFGLGTIGLVAAGPHGRCNGFEVRAGLVVQQPGQPGHPVGTLRAQMQPAATRPVVVVEQAVGIEVVGDPLA